MPDTLRQLFSEVFFGIPAAKVVHYEDAIKAPAVGTAVVDVIVPENSVLTRVISVPSAARSSHRAVAELDMLRKTPFSPDAVYWTVAAPQKNTLSQLIAKKSELDGFRAALEKLGYRVRRFLVQHDGRYTFLADFTETLAPSAPLWRRMNAALLGAILCLCLGIWLYPAWTAQQHLNLESAAVDDLRSEAVLLRQQIEELQRVDSERRAFVQATLRQPRLITALRQLTVALPDDVWVSDMMFTQEQITLNGETESSAADLVLQLTNGRLGYTPGLSGPVSRTSEGKERFTMTFSPDRGAL